ncbi:hypothetical protein [Streptosporangium sp. NPDC000509]|uniref:hypothetical protein n=1 Tax=Streptosporangium sp. NPDC000509 TaxID=3366186 RepID=UPI003698BDEE
MTDIPTETNGHRPEWTLKVAAAIPEQGGPVDDKPPADGAEVVSLETVRDRRHPYPPTPAAPERYAPVLEGEVIRVDAPARPSVTGAPSWPRSPAPAARSSRCGCARAAKPSTLWRGRASTPLTWPATSSPAPRCTPVG